MHSLRKYLLVFLLTGLLFPVSKAFAVVICTFSGSGNFSNATYWDHVPAVGDNIIIKGTCTFDASASNLAYGNLCLGDAATNGTLNWPVGGTNTINVNNLSSNSSVGYSGTINMSNGGILQIRGTWTSTRLNLTAGSSGTGKIIMASSASAAIPSEYTNLNNLSISANSTATVSAGAAITVNGSLEINSGIFAPGNNLIIKKNWTFNGGTFTPGTYTTTFSGSSAQTISGTYPTTFYNLALSNSAGLSSSANTTVSNILTLTTGVFTTTGGTSVIIPLGGSVSRVSGFVAGQFKKWISNTTAKTFEIGTGANYSPAEVTFTSITTAGYLTVTTTNGDHANLCSPVVSIDGEQSLNRYWSLIGGGVAPASFKLKVTYVAGDLDSPTPSYLTRALYTNSGGVTWSSPAGSYMRTSTSTELSGFSSFGDFIVGTPYTSAAIVYQMGPTDSTNVGVSTSFSLSASGSYPHYQWQKNGVNISNGGAFSGVTTATLTVTPTATTDAGDYRCVVSGTCGDAVNSVTVSLSVFDTREFTAAVGNWSDAASWASGIIPAITDSVYIPSGKTVSLPSSFAAYCKSLTLSGTLDIVGNATLTGDASGRLVTYLGANVKVEKNFPTNFGTFDFRGTTEFYGSSTQSIPEMMLGDVILSGVGTKIMDGNLIGNSLTIESGATLDIVDDLNSVEIYSNFINDGTFESRNGTVKFLRLGDHFIQGSTETVFSNVTIGIEATVKQLQNCTLRGTLQLLDTSSYNTNGYIITLTSEAADHAARIGTIWPSSSFTGQIKQQRYIPWYPPAIGTSYNWHAIGFALVGTSFTGITYDESLAGNINYGYSDSVAPYTNLEIPGLMNGVYSMISGGNDTLIEVTGAPITGSYTKNLSYTDTNNPSADGWNLLCNPYPSTICITSDSITCIGTSETFYVWSPAINDYTFFNKNSGGDGEKFLAPNQGFWMQASSAHDAVRFGEQAKSENPTLLNRSNATAVSGSQVLELTVNDLTNSNQLKNKTFVRFGPDFLPEAESDNDSYRLFSGSSSIPNLSTLSIDNKNLALNSLPEITGNTLVPVYLRVRNSGPYSISAANLGTFPSSTCIVLEDLDNGTFFDLRSNAAYTFIANTSSAPVNRFVLHFSAPATIQTTNASCHGTPDGRALVQGTGNGPWTYTWYNELGQLIRSVTSSQADSINTLTAGNYTVVIGNSGGTYCNSVSATVQIGSLPQIMINGAISNPNCSDTENGAIDLSVSGGAAPYSYLWSDNQTTATINNLSAGNYTVVVSDANNCSETRTLEVAAEHPLSAAFATSTSEHVIGNSPAIMVAFVNSSTGADSYMWDFGDGSPVLTSTLQNMAHSYHAAGIYHVLLTASNAFCSSSYTLQLEILTVSGIGQAEAANLLIYQAGKQVFIQNNGSANTMSISITNTLGQLVFKQDYQSALQEKIKIDLSKQANGVYFVNAYIGNAMMTQKITLTN